MEVYMAPGLFAWDVTLETGEARKVLSAGVPIGFASPVVSAIRGPAYGNAPAPAVASLTPAQAALGSADFTLHVIGSNFRDGDVIVWNGSPEPTELVSPTELTTEVDMSTAEVPMPIPVKVRALNGAESNAVVFTLNPAP